MSKHTSALCQEANVACHSTQLHIQTQKCAWNIIYHEDHDLKIQIASLDPLKNTDSYILMTKQEECNKIQNSHNSGRERIKGRQTLKGSPINAYPNNSMFITAKTLKPPHLNNPGMPVSKFIKCSINLTIPDQLH